MKKRFVLFSLACAAAVTLGGCAHFYMVTDPATGRVYYTDGIDRMGNGAVRFKDDVTKNRVTLGTSEIMEITEDQYKAKIHIK